MEEILGGGEMEEILGGGRDGGNTRWGERWRKY